MKKLFIIALTCVTSVLCYAQSDAPKNIEKWDSLQVKFVGKQYDNVLLAIVGNAATAVGVKGRLNADSTWVFKYRDTLSKTLKWMFLQRETGIDTLTNQIYIEVSNGDKSIFTSNIFPVDSKKFTFHYLNSTFEQAVPFYMFKDVIIDRFRVEQDLPADYVATELGEHYGFFGDSLTYEQYIDLYVDLTKRYPKSLYFISRLYSTLELYESQSDIKMLYDLFDVSVQQSYYGNLIAEYLRNRFENTILTNALSGESEAVVLDETRYTFVIFSASWCAPCHKIIPKLKQVYDSLKTKVDFVYVSIDEPKYFNEWRDLIKKENIPWRTMLIDVNVAAIRQKYFVHSIPHSFLVLPDKSLVRLDIRDQSDLSTLYKLVL